MNLNCLYFKKLWSSTFFVILLLASGLIFWLYLWELHFICLFCFLAKRSFVCHLWIILSLLVVSSCLGEREVLKAISRLTGWTVISPLPKVTITWSTVGCFPYCPCYSWKIRQECLKGSWLTGLFVCLSLARDDITADSWSIWVMWLGRRGLERILPPSPFNMTYSFAERVLQ